ncbi:MAG: hypothetical protein A6F71_02165 [Cycloclasticus sp. symbiont of Poecilosclerida sp. M]|nr:MAG: hypothetical protein A6F71_02165 [Cycloclasticus sp. symbiont of Poecilosclerida sp. M]
MSKAKKVLATACLISSTSVFALGIGDITAYSALNQALNAEIALVGSENEDPSNIRISIASREAFNDAGIDRPYFLNELKFTPIVEENGEINVKVTTRNAIKEPFVNFIIELEWPKGRTLKEFTILLDPPVTMRDVKPNVVSPEISTQVPKTPKTQQQQLQAEKIIVTTIPAVTTSSDYGPTIKHDTLWSIAKIFTAQNTNVTHAQMMLALFHNNPEAFYQNNINALKKGHILKLPKQQTTNNLIAKQARDEFRRQNKVWSETFQASQAAKTEQPSTSNPEQPEPTVGSSTKTGADVQLKLLSPSENTNSTTEKAEGNSEGEAAGALNAKNNEKNLALEMVATLEDERNEATSRVVDLQSQVEKLQHLLTLKNEQLAQLQNNAATSTELENNLTKNEPEKNTHENEESVGSKTLDATPVISNGSKEEKTKTEPAKKSEPVKTTKPPEDDDLMLYAVGGLVILLLAFIGLRKKKKGSIEFEEESEVQIFEEPEFLANDTDELDDGLSDDFLSTEEAEEVDPLDKCDELIASNELQKAEETIQKARSSEPNNVTYTQKLFEILYRASDADGFQTLANDVNEIQHSNPEVWESVEEMGKELCPTSVLFMTPVSDSTSADISDVVDEIDDTSDQKSNDDVEFDFNFNTVQQNSTNGEPQEETTEDTKQIGESSLPEEQNSQLSEVEALLIKEQPNNKEEELEAIDFKITDPVVKEASAPSADTNTDSSMKDIDTKISLAKIYIEMQDDAAAKDALEDVLSHGTDEQKKEAQSMLNKL